MRKVSEKILDAMLRGKRKKCSNTRTENHTLYLHDNAIAMYCPRTDTVACTMAGWPTVTTRSRLNDLMRFLGKPYRFQQSKHEQQVYYAIEKKAYHIDPEEIIVL